LWEFELSTLADPVTLSETSPTTSIPSDDDPFPPRHSANPYLELAGYIYWVQNVGTGEYLCNGHRRLFGDQSRHDSVGLIVLSHVRKLPHTIAEQFSFVFAPNSAEFRSQQPTVGYVDGDCIMIRDIPPSESDPTHASTGNVYLGWCYLALDRHKDPKGGYYYLYVFDSCIFISMSAHPFILYAAAFVLA
jgi:hypothetical protein